MEHRIPKIASISTGHQSRKAIENEELGTHFLLQIRDFNEARTKIQADGMIRFSPSSPDKEQPLRPNDVVLLARGQKNFAFAVPEFPHPTLVSSYFFILRPNESVTGPYLAWYLNQPAAQRHFKKLATTGAHMPIVNRDVIERLKVPVPDLPSQQKILGLDALAATQSRLLDDLAKKKRTLAASACRKRMPGGDVTQRRMHLRSNFPFHSTNRTGCLSLKDSTFYIFFHFRRGRDHCDPPMPTA